MSTFQLPKTSLEAIPILGGKSNYSTWAKQMESHLRASRAWLIIEGRWPKPKEPLSIEAPLRAEDLIEEYRAKHQAMTVQGDLDTPSSSTATPVVAAPLLDPAPYIPLTLEQAEKELKYVQAVIDRWNRWDTAERTGINDINARISQTCRDELGKLDSLVNIWTKLKTLYVIPTVGTWVRELNEIGKLIGARKEGEDPDEWLRKILLRYRSIKENLGELSLDIYISYAMSVQLGKDLNATVAEAYRQTKWPSPEDLAVRISQEYQSQLTSGKTRPTASARPSNEDPRLNLTQKGQKRQGEPLSSPAEKKQDTSRTEDKRRNLPVCPICTGKHPIKEEGQCYLAKPETAPASWRERNKDRIEAFKRSK
jgi:hypothetical protein